MISRKAHDHSVLFNGTFFSAEELSSLSQSTFVVIYQAAHQCQTPDTSPKNSQFREVAGSPRRTALALWRVLRAALEVSSAGLLGVS